VEGVISNKSHTIVNYHKLKTHESSSRNPCNQTNIVAKTKFTKQTITVFVIFWGDFKLLDLDCK
jgi:hypothetical protein